MKRALLFLTFGAIAEIVLPFFILPKESGQALTTWQTVGWYIFWPFLAIETMTNGLLDILPYPLRWMEGGMGIFLAFLIQGAALAALPWLVFRAVTRPRPAPKLP